MLCMLCPCPTSPCARCRIGAATPWPRSVLSRRSQGGHCGPDSLSLVHVRTWGSHSRGCAPALARKTESGHRQLLERKAEVTPGLDDLLSKHIWPVQRPTYLYRPRGLQSATVFALRAQQAEPSCGTFGGSCDGSVLPDQISCRHLRRALT